MRTMIRCKRDKAKCLQIDIDTIESLRIGFSDTENIHHLQVFCKLGYYNLHKGSFDECHRVLNKVNDIINASVIDL